MDQVRTKQGEIIRTPEQKEAHNAYLASLRRAKIREGIRRIEIEWYGEPPNGTIATYHRTFVSHLLSFLHENDVAIKVERELPSLEDIKAQRFYAIYMGHRNERVTMLKAGYTAVEPLIEETDGS